MPAPKPLPTYTVGEVARLAGVSVRALHHFESLGLLLPSERSDAGYRLYSGSDLERLHTICVYRALGIPLIEIRKLLDDRSFSREAALREQVQRLQSERRRIDGLLHNLERVLDTPGGTMSPEKLFNGVQSSEIEAEAEARWGKEPAFAESKRRTARYTPETWAKIHAEIAEIEGEFATLLGRGVPTDAPAVAALVDRHRGHIDRWFYACTPQIHLGLAGMYAEDPRFRDRYEARAPGLAAYLSDAIAARWNVPQR